MGSTIGFAFDYGDGNSDDVTATVTSLNSAEDYFSAMATFTHTYASAGPYLAAYEECCRVSSIQSGAGETIRMETSVQPFSSTANHAPVVSLPAIVTVPLRGLTTFRVTAADQDHDRLNFRLSTAEEMFDTGSFACSVQQPPGLTISSDGVVSWDTTQISTAGCGFSQPMSGDLWTAQFMVEDLDGDGTVKSKVPVDVLLKFVSSSEEPPTLAFTTAGPLRITPGKPVEFKVIGDDIAPDSRVTLNATGLPLGATASNTNQALIPSVSSTFDWTPTASQTGTYIITYTATNDTMQQALGSVTITVANGEPPAIVCPAKLTAQYNVPLTIPLQVTDPQGEATSIAWSVDGAEVKTESVTATTATTELNLQQTFTDLEAHSVAAVASNQDDLSASCLVPVEVTKADQSITLPNVPKQTYGDPDMPLSAEASSGAVVLLSATGSCSLVNKALHAEAVGNCLVTATQPGDDHYNPAPPVVQQISIEPRALTVRAEDMTRQSGLPNPTFTGSVTGLIAGDLISASYTSPATLNSPVGKYPIVPRLTGKALPNYAPNITNGVLTITPGLASRLAISATPPTLTAGQNLNILTVSVLDLAGNLVDSSSAAVTLTLTGPQGYRVVLHQSAADGIADVDLRAIDLFTAGTYNITVSSPGLTTYTSTLDVVAGPAMQIVFDSVQTYSTYGQKLTQAVAGLKDANGNTVFSSSIQVTATLHGPDSELQTITDATANGVVSFDLSPLTPTGAGNYTLTLTSLGLQPASAMITVAAATQTIQLPDLPNTVFGAGPVLLPTVSSAGLPLRYTITGSAAMRGMFLVITGAGSVTVNASQNGDVNHTSVSEAKTFSVAQAPTGTVITANAKVIRAGDLVTLTAKVSSAAGLPTGKISFLDGDAIVGEAVLDPEGIAFVASSALRTGTLNLTARYDGDDNFQGSTSASSSVSVQNFTLSTQCLTSTPVDAGQTGSFLLKVTPGQTGFSSNIAFAADGLPPGSRFTFTPSTLVPGDAAATSLLTIQTAGARTAEDRKDEIAAFALALFVPFGARRRSAAKLKRGSALGLACACVLTGVMLGLAGCGSSDKSLSKAQHTFEVTVTATSGNLVHTATFALNVQ